MIETRRVTRSSLQKERIKEKRKSSIEDEEITSSPSHLRKKSKMTNNISKLLLVSDLIEFGL